MNRKIKITEFIINELKLICNNKKNFKSWMHVIWQNPRLKSKGGLKLTQRGFELLSKTNIKYFEIKSEENNLSPESKFILWLDNNFDSPFYITRNKIYVFDEHTAIQLVLFSGSVRKMYNSYQKFSENNCFD